MGCVFWQSRGRRAAPKGKWAERIEDDWGAWGTLYFDEAEGERLLGFLQFGPAGHFPRADELPAGPPSNDAVLITCAYLVDLSAPWAMQSLFLANGADAARDALTARLVAEECRESQQDRAQVDGVVEHQHCAGANRRSRRARAFEGQRDVHLRWCNEDARCSAEQDALQRPAFTHAAGEIEQAAQRDPERNFVDARRADGPGNAEQLVSS